MSKEYLKIVNYDKGNLLQINVQDDEFTIIQLPLLDDEVDDVKAVIDKMNNALTELQAIKEAKPSEALSRVKCEIIGGFPTGNLWVGMTPEELDAIKQALLKAEKLEKVLSVIKEKQVDMFNLKVAIDNNSLRLYNNTISRAFKHLKLTQEEFDLLKEMLE